MTDDTSPAASLGLADAAEPAPRRPRRGLAVAAVVLLVLIVLIVIGYFVAERMVRDDAETTVRDQVSAGLGLPNGDGVEIDLGGGSLLLQSLSGAIDDARINIPALDVEGLRGSAVVTASKVPLDSEQPVGGLAITFAVPEAEVGSLADRFGGSEVDAVMLEGDGIRVATRLTALGVEIPLLVSFAPSAVDGDIVLTPVDVVAAGQRLTVDELQAGLFGGLVGTELDAQKFCVASAFPDALELVDVRVDGKQLLLDLDGDGAVLGGDALAARGVCPAE